MTTNIEWLYENDRETLIIMTSGDCDKCKYDPDCANAFCRCERSWLEAEYVEPDSWEKIEYDAMGLSQTLNELYSCPVDITNEVVNLVLRCEKLAGVE